MAPLGRSDAAPAAVSVAQTESYRALTIPWIEARATMRRSVSWLAGQGVDARPSQAWWMIAHPAQWRRPISGSLCIALAAYSCRDSLGFGKWSRFRPSFLTAFPN